MMPSFFIGYMLGHFYLLPTIVVKLGRDTETQKPAAIMLAANWLCFEAGMEIEIYTHRP